MHWGRAPRRSRDSYSWGFLKKKTIKKRGSGDLGSDLCHKEWRDQVAIHGSAEGYRLSWANIVTLSKAPDVSVMWELVFGAGILGAGRECYLKVNDFPG